MPDLKMGTRLLKPYQVPSQVRFLMARDSGMNGKPTRWGKTWDAAGMILAYVFNPGFRIVVTAPGIDLCQQLHCELAALLKPFKVDVRGLYTGSKDKVQGPQVTVVCSKSLHKCDADDTRLVIVDETHAWASDDNAQALARFQRAMIFGMGATLEGRSDRRDRLLTGLIGPVLAQVSYLEAVELGAISPVTVIMLRVPVCGADADKMRTRASAYKLGLYQSPEMAAVVRRILTEAIPHDWQTMVFIEDEKQADYWLKAALDKVGVVAMAKKLAPAARRKLTAEIAAARHKRVAASKIYIQGVTFPDLRVLINAAGGGSNTGTIQRPGRLLQKRPGKNYGVMIDFRFTGGPDCPQHGAWWCLARESAARQAAYEKIGYRVLEVGTVPEMVDIILNSHDHGITPAQGAADQPVPEPKGRKSRAPRTVAPPQ